MMGMRGGNSNASIWQLESAWNLMDATLLPRRVEWLPSDGCNHKLPFLPPFQVGPITSKRTYSAFRLSWLLPTPRRRVFKFISKGRHFDAISKFLSSEKPRNLLTRQPAPLLTTSNMTTDSKSDYQWLPIAH